MARRTRPRLFGALETVRRFRTCAAGALTRHVLILAGRARQRRRIVAAAEMAARALERRLDVAARAVVAGRAAVMRLCLTLARAVVPHRARLALRHVLEALGDRERAGRARDRRSAAGRAVVAVRADPVRLGAALVDARVARVAIGAARLGRGDGRAAAAVEP